MPGGMEVFRGMLILRIIAAAHLPADHAHPQVDPGITNPQAFQTTIPTGLDIRDLISVGADLGRRPAHPHSWLFGHNYSF